MSPDALRTEVEASPIGAPVPESARPTSSTPPVPRAWITRLSVPASCQDPSRATSPPLVVETPFMYMAGLWALLDVMTVFVE